MNAVTKIAAALTTLALVAPGAAVAKKDGAPGSGKATAPGQVCKSLKVKGKKTAEQKAAYKACIKDAVAKKKAAKAPKAPEAPEAVEAPKTADR